MTRSQMIFAIAVVLVATFVALIPVIVGYGTCIIAWTVDRHTWWPYGTMPEHGMMMIDAFGNGAYGMELWAMGPRAISGYRMPPSMIRRHWRMFQPLNLSTEDVTNYLERRLAWQGNSRLTLGDVSERDEDIIVADLVTSEGNVLVQRLVVNRHTGTMWTEQD